MNEDLVRYIEQNRDLYTRDAIIKQLLDAGYQSVEIGAAWKEVDARHAPPPSSSGEIPSPPPRGWRDNAPAAPQQPVVAMPAFWGVLVFFIALSYGPLGVLYYTGSGNSELGGQIGTVVLVLFGAIQVAALVGGAILLRTNRAWGMGLLVGVVTVVVLLPCLIVLIVLGTCIGILSEL